MIEKYTHHGNMVFVDSELKGKHRDNCLCFSCDRFDINDRGNNCAIANVLYSICVAFSLVTPVYECPIYKTKK